MHVLIVPFGSHGDVHPLLGLGGALRRRGHRVTFIVSEYFGPLVRGLGFAMLPLGEDARFHDVMKDPDLWHPRKGLGVVAGVAVEAAELVFRHIQALNEPGETVAVGGSLALGVRLAQEALGVPAATVHLQPAVLHSDVETPNYGGLDTSAWPPWLKRIFFRVVFARMVDTRVAPGLNAARARLGLPKVRRVMREWVHSPQLVLGFFPAWYGPSQPDWPPNVRLVGFPLFDEREASPMPPALETFLAEGTPPIAFTPGSANLHARTFFEAAAEACARLGRRGLLLTRFADQVPATLSPWVMHVPFAPFGLLLPRVAALVHHGGIGTAAQAMAAGVPQLVMPLAHDQFDNAARLGRLGVAHTLLPANFRGPEVAEALHDLLASPDVARRCRGVAGRFSDGERTMERACEAIEALARNSPAPVPAGPILPA